MKYHPYTTFFLFSTLLVTVLSACSQSPTPQGMSSSLEPLQLGTQAYDAGCQLATNTQLGAVYLSGYTEGTLASPRLGSALIRRYDRSGKVIWGKQLNSLPCLIDVDANGQVYRVGFDTGGNYGTYILSKYNSSGTFMWSRKFSPDEPTDIGAVEIDAAGNIYMVGSESDLGYPTYTLVKYNSSGTLQYAKVINAEYGPDLSIGWMSSDASGNIYVAASEEVNYVSYGTLLKFNPGGSNIFYIRGTRGRFNDVEVKGSTVYVGGAKYYYEGEDDIFVESDAYLAKYSLSGTLSTAKSFGTTAAEEAQGVSADASGNVYLIGTTKGALGGTNLGGNDIFVRKYGSSGSVAWTKQFGSSKEDTGRDIAVYGTNEVYLTGSVSGKLSGGTYGGGVDAFLRRMDASGKVIWTDQ